MEKYVICFFSREYKIEFFVSCDNVIVLFLEFKYVKEIIL